jgi:plastocyanin
MVLGGGLLPVLLALSACGGDEASSTKQSSKASTVAIDNFVFVPGSLTVRAGTKVTWTNQDASPHAIKDKSVLATPESPQLAQGDTFSITYPKAGAYPYICGIHNYMIGSVEVTD